MIRTEPIQVIAEAYDVAVDIAFPKGIPTEKIVAAWSSG